MAVGNCLTADRLRELLTYHHNTGVFVWIQRDKKRRPRARASAGWIDRKGYILIEIDRTVYRAHALAWFYVYGVWPTGQLDHKNMDQSDNRIENLRECNTQQNCSGRALRKDNVTGFKGVSPLGNKWRARIRVNYKGIDLGIFDDVRDAAEAYDAAAVKYFGEFARTNKMLGLL
jgi:hypothetical protein